MLQSFLNCLRRQPKFKMNRDYGKDVLSSVQDILPFSFQKHYYNNHKEFQGANDQIRISQEQGMFSPNPSQTNIRLNFLENADEQILKPENPFYCQFSLDYFGMNNKFRQYCILVNESRAFQYAVYIYTSFCIIILIIKPYNDEESGFGISLNDDQISSIIIIADVIFSFHHLISIISYGLWSCKYGYYRNPISFINGIALFFALFIRQSYFYSLRILFLLEFFVQYKMLKIVRKFCLTVEHSFISIVYITIIICFFFYVFSIVGLQIWTGMLGNYCINENNEIDFYPSRLCGYGRSCSVGYECKSGYFEQPFIQYSHNFTKFDYIQESMASLFIVHYIEGWVEIEQRLADSFNKYVSTIYLWTYIIISSFFLQNLVVAILLKQSQQEIASDEPVQTVLFINSHTKISLSNEKRKTVFQTPNYLSKSKQRVMTMLMNSTKRSNEQRKTRIFIKSILTSKITRYLYSMLFLANLVVLSLNDESAYKNNIEGTLAKVNVFFLIIYLLEDIARIYIWRQKESKIIIMLEFTCDFVCLVVQLNQLENPFILNTLKGIRLLWVFNSQTSWSNYRVLLSALWKSFNNIPIMILILFVYGLVIGLIGRNFFAGQLRFNSLGFYDLNGSYIPRANFDSMRETITSLFIIVCSDQWQTIFYTTLETGSWVPYVFFIFVKFICKFFILPSFLTLMLDNYEDAKNEADLSKARAAKIISTMQSKSRIVPTKEASLLQVSNSQSEKKRFFGRLSKVSDDSEKEEDNSKQLQLIKRQQSKFYQVQIFKSGDISQVFSNSSSSSNLKQYLSNSSLFILHNRSNLRKKLHILIQQKYYDWGMSFIILLNLILLGYDTPLRQENITIDVLNYIFTGLFIIDALIKILAQGFYWNKLEPQKSYIINNNNQLDFIILIISSIDDLNIYKNQYLKAFRTLRTLRILTTLRRGSQNEQLNLISRSLLQTISLLSSMIFVTGISLWILSIICMTIWKGKLNFCSQVTLENFDQIATQKDCTDKGGQWINNITNYDTIQDSLLCLFRLIIGEGWTQQMFSVSDITDRGLNPKLNSSTQYQLFFYVLIFFLNIVLLNLITGLIINNYRTIKENIANFQQLNEFQKQWIQMMQIMQKKKLINLIPKPQNKQRLFCFKLANNNYFEGVILILLLVNLIFCSSYSGKQSSTTKDALYGIDILFIVIFHIELFIKLLAYWIHFFRDNFNKFDLIVLIITDALLILKDNFDLPRLYTIPLILRSLKIIRANKLFKFNKQLRVLIDVIQDLIPTLFSVIVFIAITIIIYSLIGVQTFSTIWSTASDPQYPYTMEENQRTRSFSNFLDGILILIDVSTGQYWALYMADYTIDTQGCYDQTPDQFQLEGARGCSTIFGFFFFISYLVLIRIIMASLFLAMIIESYQECQLENTAAINPYQLEDFLIKWSDYDPQGTGWITPEDYAFLMFEINPPLGFKDENSQYYDYAASKNQKLRSHIYNHKKKMRLFKTEIFQKLSDYQVQIYENQMVHFKDICIQLAYNAIKKKNDLLGIEQIEEKIILRQIRKSWESRYPDLIGKKAQQFAVDIFAINSITDILRGVIERRKIKKRIKEMQKEKNLKQLEINENAYKINKTINERYKGRRKSQIRKRVYPFVQTNSNRRNKFSVEGEQAMFRPKKNDYQSQYQQQQQQKIEDKSQLTNLNFYIDPNEMCNGFPMKVVYETQKIDFPPINSEKSLGTVYLSQSEKQVKKLGGYISERCSDEENQQDSIIQNFKKNDMFE